MEAVPRMPMIWLDLKEAGDFSFQPAVKKFVLKNYGENPETYNEELKKLELLRQSAVNVPRDFEGCSVLRKYLGQLHYLQSRIPMGLENEAAVPVTWTEIFSGKSVTHEDIKYEQACILYNLGALHSMLGAMDKRVSEEGMKVSCTHFQCAAGAFTYLREHFPISYSVDMSHQILNLNVNLMLGQAQECLLEKSMLDNRKSFLVARISAQVVDYYKEACRALESSETASLLGKIQKDWKKLVQMKIYYFAAVAHLHMGKQAEEQQKFGERVVYFQSALDKLNEAIKMAKGQPETVQDALRFTMDIIGGKFNSAKKDNDFIYHEAVPPLDTLQPVKGAPLVKPLPVNPTDPAVTGPDIFAKLVPMAAHEASSLYSEEKAKLLREVMAKIDAKNEVLDQFMDSLQLDPDTVDDLELYNQIPPLLMEKCAALSVRPDTVKNLVQSMQELSGVYTDVEASLKDIKALLEGAEPPEPKGQEAAAAAAAGGRPSPELAEVRREWSKYTEVHEKASFTNSELHRAMNLHVGNLRLLSGPLDQVRAALPAPALGPEEKGVLQNLKRILTKAREMREQRQALERQLRDQIQKDDLTTALVTADRSEMQKLFSEQLKKYDQLRVYLDQNLAAQENVLAALTKAHVQFAPVRRLLADLRTKWDSTLQALVGSYEAYEDLMKKSQEGKDFYADLESKVAALLERARAARQQQLDRELKKKAPPRPTAPKPQLARKEDGEEAGELADLPAEVLAARLAAASFPGAARPPEAFLGAGARVGGAPLPFPPAHFPPPGPLYGPIRAPFPPPLPPAAPQPSGLPALSQVPAPLVYPAPAFARGPVPRSSPQHGPEGGGRPAGGPADGVQAPGYGPGPARLCFPGPGAPAFAPYPYPPRAQPPFGPAGFPAAGERPPPAYSAPLAFAPRAPLPPAFPGRAPGPPAQQAPFPFPAQPGVLGQLPPPLRAQLYPPPARDPSGLAFPHPGAAPAPLPGGRPVSPSPPALPFCPAPPAPGGPAAPAGALARPESQHGGSQPPGGGQPLLQPTKADAAEGQRPQALRLIERDPYERPERLRRLRQELEAFRGAVGAGPLDGAWRRLQEAQERDARGRSIAVARCYALKNRHQDVMPYDGNRVVLRSGKDDYINASRLDGLSPYCPPLVATQAPLPGTAADFWLMVHEQKVSVIVMLVADAEMEKQKVARYFPTERGRPMAQGPLTLALSSVRTTATHVERVLSLQFRDQSLKRSLVHLHFPTWPELGLPDSPEDLLSFIHDVHTHYLHQRPLHTPIVVHCSSGVGRTGAFALLYAAVQEVEAGNGIPDLPQLVRRMRQQRKHMLQEKLHLKFCYEAVVRHVEQVLQRHGLPPPPGSRPASAASQKPYLPPDLVLGGDVPISSIQATIAKLSIRPAPGGGSDPPPAPEDPAPAPPEPAGPPSPPPPEPPEPAEESPAPAAPGPAPPSSSLELLASLTPEAFSLDGSARGKQRMSKHSFLQAPNGQGLRGARPADDPLSLLDPLWSLNKT
ncbi:tyrosine-protein phosphatase non-receptor type 23 [Tachyglossus aculeatus]|uniref:tyrosine-protein phosphatase non-receptor type 23 n=1 Tax=Tachyglossus aculeatus TaxID=9261 RepID=UPI0018F70C15|nr:tyrosine-protein phosphatase non-receptor type 23 [Tachyglossus aculeatus]